MKNVASFISQKSNDSFIYYLCVGEWVVIGRAISFLISYLKLYEQFHFKIPVNLNRVSEILEKNKNKIR